MATITKQELTYDIDKLILHVEKRQKNIELFEKAISDEWTAIRQEKHIIETLKADLNK